MARSRRNWPTIRWPIALGGQNITLLTKLKTPEERLRYAARAVEHGWSRPLLTHHIELRTLEREGKAVINFEQRLPKLQSDLARETLKDPYRFDFLSLGSEAGKRGIEACSGWAWALPTRCP